MIKLSLILLLSQIIIMHQAYGADATREKEPLAVFYFKQNGEFCDWVAQNIADNTINIFFRTPQCPDFLLWDTQSQKSIYAVKGDIYSFKWRNGFKPIKYGAIPEENLLQKIFVEKGEIRFVSLVPVPNNNIITKDIDGEKTFFYRYHGKEYTASNLASWGAEYMAILQGYKNTTPYTIAIRPTKFDAGNTPGIDVLTEYFKEDNNIFELNDILFTYTQYWHIQHADGESGEFSEFSREQKRRILEILDIETSWEMLEMDRPYYLRKSSDQGILVKSELGDSPHFVPPIYFCRDKCGEIDKLEINSDLSQLSINIQGEYVLIGNEYDNNESNIFIFGQSTPLLKLQNAKKVIFEPFDNFWKIFSQIKYEPDIEEN